MAFNKATKLHDLAMRMADHARSLDGDAGRDFYKLASALEANAAKAVSVEPSRSVLYRSAASLALCGGDLDKAADLARLGLGGGPPADIADELREVLWEISKEQTP